MYRPEWWPRNNNTKNYNHYTLLEICQDLHMATNGSYDISKEQIEILEDSLIFIISRYKDPINKYDSLVLQLCIQTLINRGFSLNHQIHRT